MSFWRQLFRRRNLEELLAESAKEQRLHRVLDTRQLTYIGIGGIIGTGIFVLIGEVAKETTGPAITLSFAVAGVLCVFAALCYAEFASMAPVEGSAYTYGYCTMGEFFAWIIAWDLVLEYAVAAAAVAHGWSGYARNLLGLVGSSIGVPFFEIDGRYAGAPFNYSQGEFVWSGSYADFPAIFISFALTVLLIKGIKESASFNAYMVLLKVGVILVVIAVGAFYINPDNWSPFAPYGYAGVGFFGETVIGQTDLHGHPAGVLAGAAIMFFAYIGFDGVSAHSAEAIRPERDVPRAILISLAICTVLYIAMGGVLTGMVPYQELDTDAPVAEAFARVNLPFMQFLIGLAAVAGMTSVMLVSMLTQPRILMALARDGLLPHRPFGVVHPRFKTPWISTMITGVFVAALAGFLPFSILADLVSIGTLLAFGMVCAAVLIMRYTDPDARRPFKTPFFPFVPIAGILGSLLLMFSLPAENWLRLAIWLALGMVIYFGYGFWNSKEAKKAQIS